MKKILIVLLLLLCGCSRNVYHPSDYAYLYFFDEEFNEEEESYYFEYDDEITWMNDTVYFKSNNAKGKIDKDTCEIDPEDGTTICDIIFDKSPIEDEDIDELYDYDSTYIIYTKDKSEVYFSNWFLDKTYKIYYSEIYLSFEK